MRDKSDTLCQRKTQIADEEDYERAEQHISTPPFVGKETRRIRDQRRNQIKSRVDQDGRFQRSSNILGPQDKERVAGVAESEEGSS